MSTAVYYSIEEVSKNNGKNGSQIWIIINNSVYNVTEYLANNKHPGGTDLIEEYAGRNATKAFNEIGHSADAKNLLKTFKIGELVQNEVPEELKNLIQLLSIIKINKTGIVYQQLLADYSTKLYYKSTNS